MEAMKERPIIFSASMVLAILEDRKTQMRRIVKFPDGLTTHDDWIEAHEIAPAEYVFWSGPKQVNPDFTRSVYKPGDGIICPYGKPGDRLWVRETWQPGARDIGMPEYAYRADGEVWYDGRWRASIHMPRVASRILLEITDIRVERLREITHEDAMAEGFELTGWRPTYYDPDSGGEARTPQDNFAEMWEKIHGSESWWQNPWVWAITFKRIEP